MTTTRDITCDLIERPRDRRRPNTAITMRDTPHGEAIGDRIDEMNMASSALLAMGCLIDYVRITPDEVRIRLLRCPLASVLRRRSSVSWRIDNGEPGEALRGVIWRGVFVEYPVLATDWN
ncbi:hypothetical protein [Salinisphaera hydrothermalis]|uniref:hypothetical protein n=1 Tax=Salinisphaera hydrothermalis TaxID=563188 RepID=UPI003341FC47